MITSNGDFENCYISNPKCFNKIVIIFKHPCVKTTKTEALWKDHCCLYLLRWKYQQTQKYQIICYFLFSCPNFLPAQSHAVWRFPAICQRLQHWQSGLILPLCHGICHPLADLSVCLHLAASCEPSHPLWRGLLTCSSITARTFSGTSGCLHVCQ